MRQQIDPRVATSPSDPPWFLICCRDKRRYRHTSGQEARAPRWELTVILSHRGRGLQTLVIALTLPRRLEGERGEAYLSADGHPARRC